METASQVHVDDPVEFIVGVFDQRFANVYSRSADYDVQCAVLFDDLTEGVVDGAAVSDVYGARIRRAAFRGNGVGGVRRCITVDI
jgi:hypothetical protein